MKATWRKTGLSFRLWCATARDYRRDGWPPRDAALLALDELLPFVVTALRSAVR